MRARDHQSHDESMGKIAAALAASIAIVTFGAPSTAADTVSVNYVCGASIWHWNEAFHVTITAPATATRNQTVTVTASLVGTNAGFLDPVPADTYQAALTITLGGASSGTITATGLTNPALPARDPLKWNGGRAQVTLANAGNVTFKPGGFAVTEDGFARWTCIAQGSPAVADTTVVS
jgi:hypothetical protein